MKGLAVDVVHEVTDGFFETLVSLATDVAGAAVKPHVAEVVFQGVEPPLAVLAVAAASHGVLDVVLKVVNFVVNCGEWVAANLAGVKEPSENKKE